MYIKIGNKVETDAVIQKLDNNDFIIMLDGISVARCVFKRDRLIIAVANYEDMLIELCDKRMVSILHYSGMRCDYSIKGELHGKYYMRPDGYEHVGMRD